MGKAYRMVREYSLVKGDGDIQLSQGDTDAAIDIDENMQKIEEIAQYLAQSEMEKINGKVEELRWDKEIATKTVQIQEKTCSERRHGGNWS